MVVGNVIEKVRVSTTRENRETIRMLGTAVVRGVLKDCVAAALSGVPALSKLPILLSHDATL
jgi:hypothetical protein